MLSRKQQNLLLQPNAMCLPNTTLKHYHDTNLLLYCALCMGRDRNTGNKQNLVLCQEEGEWVNGTEATTTEF